MNGVTRHVDAATALTLPGRYLPLHLRDALIGYILPETAERMRGFGVRVEGGAVVLADSAALTRQVAALAEAGLFKLRQEDFDVRARPGGPVLARVDRGALPCLGIAAEGVHVNGLVRTPDGISMWVGVRNATKALDPGKLDQMVAGGIAAGMDADATLVKEAWEEASLPSALAAQAVFASTLGYTVARAEGLRRDLLHCYDLVLPADFQPVPRDGEVERFFLLPLPDVLARVRDTDDFKFNVNFVLIDLLARHGLADAALAARIRQQGNRSV